MKPFIKTILRSYAAVFFNDNLFHGLIILIATFFQPQTGVTGLLGTVMANLGAKALGVHEDKIRSGIFGFNGLLVGLSVSLYYQLDLQLLAMLFAAILLLIFITLTFDFLMQYFLGLPVLSVPFVIESIMIYLAFFNSGTGYSFHHSHAHDSFCRSSFAQ